MTGWALLVVAMLCATEAVRASRREPRVPAARTRRSSIEVLAIVGSRFAGALPGRLARPPDPALVRRAGVPFGGRDVVAARVGGVAVFGAVGALGGATAGGLLGMVVAAALAGFGWAYPVLWVRSAASMRAARIEHAAPALMELVAAGVEAGIPLDAALAGAARATRDELAQELDRSRAAIALGRPRGEEFRDLGERTGAPTLAALGLALRLSDRLGVPLAEALRDQAERSRAEAARAVQERAARAGPRVLVVVVFVLVPAALLPIGAAVALTLAGSLAAHP
ncbi:MAG TPA: type II secretion system F family protein [Gaiellales bacterium]